MINPVNTFNPVQTTQQAYTTETIYPPQPQQQTSPDVQMSGMDAMAAYNQANISKPTEQKKMEPLVPVIITPESIKDIKGEKIYNSQGTLNSIVDKQDKETVVYKMDISNPEKAVSEIKYYNNQTGKLTKIQKNFNFAGSESNPKNVETNIVELNSDGKVQKASHYYQGKLESTEEFEYGPDGFKKIYTAVPKGHSSILEICEVTDSARLTRFDKDGQIKSVDTKDNKTGEFKTTEYKNGKPIRITNGQNLPIENTTGINPLADPELTPAQPFVLGYDPKGIQGEKSYYSNGALEKIETQTRDGKVTHLFNPDGSLGVINKENGSTIFFYNENINGTKSYVIEDKLPNGGTKTTEYDDDGSKSVRVKNGESEKELIYNKNGAMVYGESNKGKHTYMEFNKNGELVKSFD